MIRTRTAVIGFALFVALAVVASWTIYSTLQRSVTGDTDRYTATFGDVLGLRVGDDVRVAGVRVGRVDAIDLVDQRARVTFRIRSDQHLFTGTEALIRYQNLIGQRYVALAPGPGAQRPMPPGGAIPFEHTESSFDVSTVLSGFEPLFSVLQPDEVNSLSETLMQALQGDGVSLSALVTRAAALASTFRDRDEILGRVVTNLSAVVAGLANRGAQLETLITQARTLVSDLSEQGAVLEGAVERTAGATDDLAGLIATIAPGIARAQQSATAGVNLLLSNGSRLDRAAGELPLLLAGLARISGNGAYINSYVCSLDVSLWGVLLPPGLVSQVGGNAHSEVCR
ncbi:MCE family protein MceB [Nocardia nova SH22a]|uniref:MCE family protein MceB n=1 Tax=Nocardia nova SH22a TaxID=1415166 RepID=W5TAG0_9NOCA|nr:MlaD family protein [Nocardia nova]AHH16320.1 MCE family protein MceB [Nocardia nova SH22a]